MQGINALHSRYQELMRERYLVASVNHQKQMISLLRQLPPPDELTKAWILKFLDRPSKRGGKQLSPDSIAQYLAKIRVVVNWLGRPELVEGIQKPKTRKLSRADILEMSEIRRLIQFAPDSMTRALIHLITETGLRIDEALSIHVEDIVADGSRQQIIDGLTDKAQIMGRMWKIEIKRSKTFVRSVYAYDSTPSLHAWLMDHPVKKGPLFVSSRRVRVKGVLVFKEISYGQAYDKITRAYVNVGYRDADEIKRLREGIEKGERSLQKRLDQELAKLPIPRRRVHVFRHAAGTQMAKDRVHPKMMNRAMGWTPGSHAADVYIHLIDEDVEEEMRRRYGLSEEEGKHEPGIHSWICPICGNMNPPTTGICLNCPPKPQPLEDELEQMREEMDRMKIKNVEEIATLAADIAEQIIKKREEAQG
jgi:integrase